jgi:hypothetical protein
VCHQYGEKLSGNKKGKVNLDLSCGVCMRFAGNHFVNGNHSVNVKYEGC